MSQQVLAELLGRSKSWLEKIEGGQRALDRYSVIHDIAHVLQIDPTQLLGQPERGPAAAAAGTQPLPRLPPGLHLAAARRDVDVLIRRHLGDRPRPRGLWHLLAIVYAALAAEGVQLPIRCRVVALAATQCQHLHHAYCGDVAAEADKDR